MTDPGVHDGRNTHSGARLRTMTSGRALSDRVGDGDVMRDRERTGPEGARAHHRMLGREGPGAVVRLADHEHVRAISHCIQARMGARVLGLKVWMLVPLYAGTGTCYPATMNAIRERIDEVRSGVLLLQTIKPNGDVLAQGTGFLVNDAFITNDHVLGGNYDRLRVFLDNSPDPVEFERQEIEERTVGRSPCPRRPYTEARYDYRIVAIDHMKFAGRHRFMLSDRLSLFPGDQVLYLGYPLGYKNLTAHVGYVSSIHVDERHCSKVIQIDGSVNGGNSGGPVVDVCTGLAQGIITSAETGILLDRFETMMGELERTIALLDRPSKSRFAGVNVRQAFAATFRKFQEISGMVRRSANVGIGFAVPAELLAAEYKRLKECGLIGCGSSEISCD